MRRPDASEYAEYYRGYVAGVPEGDIVALMQSESDRTAELLLGLPADKGDYRYAPGKWSIKEVAGHVIDAERMFGYRAHCFARRDPAHLQSFDQNDYAASSNASKRRLPDLVDELRAVRASNIALFGSLDDDMWSRRGVGSGCEFTVRALAYIIVGHEIHHRQVIEQRYLSA